MEETTTNQKRTLQGNTLKIKLKKHRAAKSQLIYNLQISRPELVHELKNPNDDANSSRYARAKAASKKNVDLFDGRIHECYKGNISSSIHFSCD